MSYCRWSSDNFKCDVYAYESCYGGFEIHIASARYVGEIPEVDSKLLNNKKQHKKFISQLNAQSEFLETCKTEEIKLKHSGENFNVDTVQELGEKLIELKKLGYHIPEYVFERISKEIQKS